MSSIQRSQSPQESEGTQRRDGAENPLARREPPPAQQVDRFRAVMDQLRDGAGQLRHGAAEGELGREARLAGAAAQQQADAMAGKDALRADAVLDDAVHEAATRRADDPGLLSSPATATTIDPSQLWQAQGALRDGDVPLQGPPAPSGAASALADLVERHVRQMAVGGGTTGANDSGQVLLRMADSTLPGTDLVLSRSADGWVLRADARSRESYDAIREAGPGLAKRFAERNLGVLEIDPHFHG